MTPRVVGPTDAPLNNAGVLDLGDSMDSAEAKRCRTFGHQAMESGPHNLLVGVLRRALLRISARRRIALAFELALRPGPCHGKSAATRTAPGPNDGNDPQGRGAPETDAGSMTQPRIVRCGSTVSARPDGSSALRNPRP